MRVQDSLNLNAQHDTSNSQECNTDFEPNWTNLNLTHANNWKYSLASLDKLNNFIRNEYVLVSRYSKFLNFGKIFARLFIFFTIVVVFVIYYEKCFDQITSSDIDEEFLSNFTKTTRKNETFRLRIPFCSCIYKDKYYLNSNYTQIGIVSPVFIIVYLILESILIFYP